MRPQQMRENVDLVVSRNGKCLSIDMDVLLLHVLLDRHFVYIVCYKSSTIQGVVVLYAGYKFHGNFSRITPCQEGNGQWT
jgi:hypothetical protein